MEDGDNVSEISFGSVISLASLEDSAPVQGKPKRTKKTRADLSPYSSRQFPGSSHGRSLEKSTGHEAWSAAIRNGYTGLSAENPPNRWAHLRGSSKKTKISNSNRNGNKSIGAPFSRDEHILSSGKPAYKSQEDYYDEIMELRQVIKGLKTDNGVLKTKLQRITQENVLKDRQINDFLNPNKQPDEIRRTLTDRKADSSAVVSSLKQKLHLMERNVKDKESELRKLKTDLKSTNIDELRIQAETYFQETQRLQSVLSSVYSQAPGTRTIPETRSLSSSMSNRVNSPGRGGLGEVDHERLDKLLDENRRLESENRGLKKDLLSVMEGPQKKTKTSKVDYADMNRVQMLRKIGELEQLLEDAEAKVKSKSRKDDPEIQTKGFRKEQEEYESEVQKQRQTIENLKRDRSHYREEAEKLRSELKASREEIEQLREDLKIAKQRKPSKDMVSPPRPLPRQRSTTSSMKKSISFKLDKSSREKDEEQAARTLQRHWRRYNKQNVANQDKELSMTAVQIQAILRGHAARKKRIEVLGTTPDDDDEEYDMEYEDAVTRIQSALRAHHSRRKHYTAGSERDVRNRLHSMSDHSDASSEDDGRRWKVPTNGHQSLKRSSQEESSQRRSSASRYLNKLSEKSSRKEVEDYNDEEDDDDDDDDVVIGGSRQDLRGHRGTKTQGESLSRKLSSDVKESRASSSRRFTRVSEESDDEVQMPTRSQKRSPVSKNEKNQNGFTFGKPPENKEVEKTKSTFFGRETNPVVDQKQDGGNKKSAIDNLFSPSRSTKLSRDNRDDAGDDSEGSLVTSSKKSNGTVENKQKKSVFSWGGSIRKKSQESPRKGTSSDKKDNSKSSNVWASRPSEIVDDDDDEDDNVVVTPKITRRNPTKAASLLDELF